MCVVLNKQDLPVTLSRVEVEMVMQLGQLERCYEGRLAVLELSAVDSGSTRDAEQLLEWMINTKCLAAGLALPTSKSAAVLGMKVAGVLADQNALEEHKHTLQR